MKPFFLTLFLLGYFADLRGTFGVDGVSPKINFKRKQRAAVSCGQYKLNTIYPFSNASKIRQLTVYRERTNLQNLSTDSRYRDVSIFSISALVRSSLNDFPFCIFILMYWIHHICVCIFCSHLRQWIRHGFCADVCQPSSSLVQLKLFQAGVLLTIELTWQVSKLRLPTFHFGTAHQHNCQQYTP